MPFEKGNKLASGNKKSFEWKKAIERALQARENGDDPKALAKLAEKLLRACDKEDVAALRELGDRIDGKSVQAIEHSGGGLILNISRTRK